MKPSNNLENKTPSASIYKSLGSQFLRTTTRIQPGPDNFEESRFIMTFLTIFGVAEIFSVRLKKRT